LAGSQKEFELLFRLKASLGNNFNKTFKSAIETQKQLQNSLKSVNSLQGKVDGYTKTSNAIEQQKSKLASLQGAHERISQRLQAHKDSVSRLADAIEKTGDSTGVLTAQLEAEKREVQKYSDSLRTNNSQIRQTTANIERNEQALKEQGNELREAGVNTDNLVEANGRLKKSYERLQSSQQTYQRLNQTQQNINESISHTKTQLVGTVGVMAAAGAAIYNGPVKKAAEFQEQMSTVQAISGATGDDLKLLSEEAKRMGATTKFTAKEAGQAMEYMAMAGWKTKDMMGGIEGVMNLAAASGEELAAVSDIVTDAMTAFGMTADGTTKVIGKNGLAKEVSNATHFADILAQASSNANTNVGMMGETFKYVAPVAGALGYTAEDTATLIGLMANSGIKASQAGTSLRRIFLGLQGGVELTGDKLGKYHLDVENADGSMRKLEDVTGDLRKAFSQMTEAEKAANAESIAGKTGMSGLLAIVNASEADYKKLTKSIEGCDGAAKAMAETKLDNMNGQITLMQSAWDALQVELGEMLLPVLTDLIKKATVVLGVVTTFVQKNPEMTKTIAKVVAGLLAFRVGMLSLKLASLTGAGGIVSLLQKLIGLRTGLLESAATGQGFAAKLAGGFAGLAGKLGGVLTGAGSKLLLILLKPFGSLGGMLGRALSKVGGVILNSPLGSIGKVFVSSFGKLGALLTPIGNVISKVLGPIGKIGSTLLGPLGGIAGKFLPIIGIITTIIAVVQMLRKNFDKVREAVGNVFGEKGLEIFDKIVAVITNVGETIKGVFSDGNIGVARDKINEIFGEKGVAVFDTFAGVFQKIITAAGQFVGFVTTHIVPVVEQVLGVLVTSVIPGIINGIKVAAPVVMQIFQAIADFIAGIIPVIGSFIAGIMPIISEVITFIQTYVFPIISEVFNFIVSTVLPFIVQGIQQLGSIITTVLSAVLPVVQTVFSTIWSIIQPILAQVLSTVQAVLPAVLSIFQSVFNAIGGVISAARQIFNGLIQFITGVFTGNWSAAWEGIKSIFSGIWNGIKSICAGVINGIIGAVNVVIRGLNSLKIPDWVPGIGGKGINIPEIPKFAKGTKKTPQTFIAGEKGPELITNAPGRTVYTAQQTRDIFNTSNEPESVPELRSGSGQKSTSITINYNPVIHVDGGKPGDLEEKLEENNRRLLQQVKDMLDKRDDDTRRSVYA
jgi:TP901 family phage tail tape measure protein